MSAWIRQKASQVRKHGKRKAAWYAVWNEPDGRRREKSCGPGPDGKRRAQLLAEKVKSQLTLGVYQSERQKSVLFPAFVTDYLKHLATRESRTVAQVETSLRHFSRILKLDRKPVSSITTKSVDEFREVRRTESGKKPGSVISPATVNKDLRTIKAALRVAHDWGQIDVVPKVRMEREPQKLPRFMTPEHFEQIFNACGSARLPADGHYTPGAFWQALMVFAQMTGWRINEILALEWADVDTSNGTAITRARSNKGKRDEVVALHPVVLEHILPLKTFHPNVFPWEHNLRTLYAEFKRIQQTAGIHVPCKEQHEHTPSCHLYGFHDARRAFATMNAANMSRETLQALMRHQSPLTTARYINYAQQVQPAVANLHVPEVLSTDVG